MYIYTISCPYTNHVVYVGKTLDFKGRKQSHLRSVYDTNISRWIRSLDTYPIIDVIDIVPDNEWKYWEYFYSDLMRQWGFKLLNMQNIGAHRNNRNHTLLSMIRSLKMTFKTFCETFNLDYITFQNTITLQGNFTLEQSLIIDKYIKHAKNNPRVRNHQGNVATKRAK